MLVQICATDKLNKSSSTIYFYCFKILSETTTGSVSSPILSKKVYSLLFFIFFNLREFYNHALVKTSLLNSST